MKEREDVPGAFRPADPDQARAQREELALALIADRFADAHQDRADRLDACAAVRLVSAVGGRAGLDGDLPGRLDTADLMSALTLLPRARAELDQMEAALLFLARAHGMTWAEIAYGLGLRSPQAAQQRSERTSSRADEHSEGSRRRASPRT